MPVESIYKVAKSLQIVVPTDIPTYELPDYLIQEALEKDKERVLSEYAYAGNALCYYFRLKKHVAGWQTLLEKSSAIADGRLPKNIYEGEPYLEYVETDELTKSIRIRFIYFKGKALLFDPQSRKTKEHLITHHGTAIVRPLSSLFEVRASHRRVAKKISYNVAGILSLGSAFSLDLYSFKTIQRFLRWIVSLNNARFEFGESEEVSAISISAKSQIDLRKTKTFQELYGQGVLRGGHATIERDRNTVNFRIFFRDGRVYFTSFSSEDDILFIAQALEKISLGTDIYAPERILDSYFK
jgi:hypothetical protein